MADVNEVLDALKDGKLTSEYQATQSGRTWGIVALVLGLLTSLGGLLVDLLGSHGGGTAATIAGAVIAVAGIALKLFVNLGYIQARSSVKVAAAQAAALSPAPVTTTTTP